ncbi:MAG: apolipoprotein N-acyltransferase, partial [Sneathiella sp.]
GRPLAFVAQVDLASLPALLGETETPKRTTGLSLIICTGIFVVLYGAGTYRLSKASVAYFEDAALRLVQPNIRQIDKWKPDLLLDHLRKLVALSIIEEGGKPRYLIWPETAVPYYLTTAPALRKELAQIVPAEGAIITGAPRRNPESGLYWNSVQVLGERGDILDIYDKQHLVPYGEYMPFRSIMMATGLTDIIPALDRMSDFATPDKAAKKVVSVPGLPPARVMICYEIAFPWEVAPQTAFSWIINVTNDGWFGNTSGPYQHFATTRTRAIEQGVPVIRAANTGISAIIDPFGRVEQQLTLNETGIIDGELPLPITERTIYARYGETLPILMVLIFIVTGTILGRRN